MHFRQMDLRTRNQRYATNLSPNEQRDRRDGPVPLKSSENALAFLAHASITDPEWA